MRGTLFRWTILLLLTTFLGSVDLLALPESQVSVDWEEGIIQLTVTHKVDDFSPQQRSRLQQETFRDLGELFLDAAKELRISSSLSLDQWISRNPRRISDLLDAVKTMRPLSSRFSREFGELIFTFHMPLFPDLASVFIDHSRGYTPAPSLFHAPSGNYTGILIYVQDTYPVFGEDRESRISPVLFPRIWDEEMKIVFEPEMMNSEDLLAHGPVSYFRSLTSGELIKRVGPNPIRIAARGLFGIVPSDPIIPRSDALSFLNSPQAWEILQLGKIALVIGDQAPPAF
ncbi:hypothetical protein [Marispirochaeta sp.]|uniref:hypothetical protein n=1 Tax=Marispirochaeta sp. TaxID=2038653 RepID=UPI0029C98FBA|nr:hypothetical protein [Marispirochaeta sp.]